MSGDTRIDEQARALLRRAGRAAPDGGVTGVCAHSDEVEVGDIFVARPDAMAFIDAALAKGAAMVVCDAQAKDAPLDAARVFATADFTAVTAALLARVYAEELAQVSLVGVTGSNGKTTTACFIGDILNALGRKTGYIGTLGYGIAGQALRPSRNTTPDVVALYRYIAMLRRQGCETIALEVSSHGIALRRIAGLAFVAAVFTNLSRDHLDFHGSMRAYKETKMSLFTDYPVARVVANRDDKTGREILANREATTPGATLGFGKAQSEARRPPPPAEVLRYAEQSASEHSGGALSLRYRGETMLARCGVGGGVNIENLAAAVAACIALGHGLPDIVRALPFVRAVPGRFQTLRTARGVNVLLDYAHTPAAVGKTLDSVLSAAPSNAPQSWCVLGCGGGRDRGKRAEMARIAAKSCRLVVCDDNVRDDCATRIVLDMLSGVESKAGVIVCRDRKQAIALALARADAGAQVFILGKGDEATIDYGIAKVAHRDSEIVAQIGVYS